MSVESWRIERQEYPTFPIVILGQDPDVDREDWLKEVARVEDEGLEGHEAAMARARLIAIAPALLGLAGVTATAIDPRQFAECQAKAKEILDLLKDDARALWA